MAWFGLDKEITAVGDTVEKTGNALDKLFTSDQERLTHAEIMERIRNKPAEWAHELNVISAQSASWWNSGWRPAMGWVGATGLALYFIPQYFFAAVLWVYMCWTTGTLEPYPVSDAAIWELVTLLLGGSFIRSQDKKQGTARL